MHLDLNYFWWSFPPLPTPPFVSHWPWIKNKVSNPQLWSLHFKTPFRGCPRPWMGEQSVLVFSLPLGWWWWGVRGAVKLTKWEQGVDLELAPIHCAFQSRLGDTLNKPLLHAGILPNASGGTRNEFHELLMLVWSRAFNNCFPHLFSGWSSHSRGGQEAVLTEKPRKWSLTN